MKSLFRSSSPELHKQFTRQTQPTASAAQPSPQAQQGPLLPTAALGRRGGRNREMLLGNPWEMPETSLAMLPSSSLVCAKKKKLPSFLDCPYPLGTLYFWDQSLTWVLSPQPYFRCSVLQFQVPDLQHHGTSLHLHSPCPCESSLVNPASLLFPTLLPPSHYH